MCGSTGLISRNKKSNGCTLKDFLHSVKQSDPKEQRKEKEITGNNVGENSVAILINFMKDIELRVRCKAVTQVDPRT